MGGLDDLAGLFQPKGFYVYKLSCIRSLPVWQRADGTAKCHLQRRPQSPRAGVLFPTGAIGAESFDPTLGILSSRHRDCESMAGPQGRVTPHPQLWLQGTMRWFTPWSHRECRGLGRQSSKERGSSTVTKRGVRRDRSLHCVSQVL